MNHWNRSISFIHLHSFEKCFCKERTRWPVDSLQKIRFGFKRSQCPNAKFEAMAVSHPLLFTIAYAGHCLGEVLWSHIAQCFLKPLPEETTIQFVSLICIYIYTNIIIWVTALTQNIEIEIIEQPRSKMVTKCLQPFNLPKSWLVALVPTWYQQSTSDPKMDLFRMLMTGSMLPSPAWAGDVFAWGPGMCNTACLECVAKWPNVSVGKSGSGLKLWIKVQAHPKCNLLFHNASLMFSGFFIKACWPIMFIWLRSTKVHRGETMKFWTLSKPQSADARASVWRRRQRRRLERRCLGMAAMCCIFVDLFPATSSSMKKRKYRRRLMKSIFRSMKVTPPRELTYPHLWKIIGTQLPLNPGGWPRSCPGSYGGCTERVETAKMVEFGGWRILIYTPEI